MTNMQRNMTNVQCGSIVENMQENMQNMQNMQNLRTMPKICKICTPHLADDATVQVKHDSFFKTALTKGEVPSAFCPFAPGASGSVGVGRDSAREMTTG